MIHDHAHLSNNRELRSFSVLPFLPLHITSFGILGFHGRCDCTSHIADEGAVDALPGWVIHSKVHDQHLIGCSHHGQRQGTNHKDLIETQLANQRQEVVNI